MEENQLHTSLYTLDAISDTPHLRAEARAFLSDHAAVTFCTSLVNLDAHAFVERVQRLLG